MGKATRTAVLNYWKSELLNTNTPEGRSVSTETEVKGLRFVYKFPDAEVSPFQPKESENL